MQALSIGLKNATKWLASLTLCAALHAAPAHLRTNALDSPLGIDGPKPLFSWRTEGAVPNWMQRAYQIKVMQGDHVVWDSGRVAEASSLGIAYDGTPLLPQTRYTWTVQTWGSDGVHSTSAPAWFETGLLRPEAWKAEWIEARDPSAEQEREAMHWMWLPGIDARKVPAGSHAQFRYVLALPSLPRAASLHVMVRGSFIARVNGKESGRHVDWGAFDREEIVHLLHTGDNVVEIEAISMHGGPHDPTFPSAAAVAVHLTDDQGHERRIVSNAGWQGRTDAKENWEPVQDAGPLATPFGLGTDRRALAPSPDRVATSASLLRKQFALPEAVRSARLTITALGAYQASVNGKPVAPGVLLAPGWTDFRKRAQYQTYDVTPLLKRGGNVMGVELGGGWYSSPMTWSGFRATPGPNLVRAQLDVVLRNGAKRTIATDATWLTRPSPVTFGEIYGGESYDARLLPHGWDTAGASVGQGWLPAVVTPPANGSLLLQAQPDLPIRQTMTVQPVRLDPASTEHPAVFDMGQNMVGNVQIRVRGARGSVVRLRYAERLNPDGSIYTTNLRNADATDTYALSGDGLETWTPHFTFHGFRYVEWTWLKGAGEVSLQSVSGLVENSLPQTPTVRLTSSSEVLNRMNELGAWGQRGNFVSIPTDCPQRDERLGWMGDAGVFWRTGTFNFDIDAFTHKFMLDVEDAQSPDGAFSNISPNLLTDGPGAPGWGDAGVFIPYAAWLQYGDLQQVEQAWPAMQRWMAFILAANPDHLRRKELGNNYGDWLAPDSHTPQDLIGTAYWALIAQEMAEMATALHHDAEAAQYRELHNQIAEAFRAAYVSSDGVVKGDTQTGYAAALFTGIALPEQRRGMVRRLTANLQAHGDHLTTGFLGTPFLLPVLDEAGETDEAFALLLNETYPSWGYMVRKGATTWWERWNGDTGDPGMNSYNHYAFGSVMSWVYRRAAGIDTDARGTGYRHLRIEPHFSERLPRLHVEYDSPYGLVTTDWDRSRGTFVVQTPPNTTATVSLPGAAPAQIGSGTHSFPVQR